MQGTSTCVDLFMLPMDGTDVVLGIQWLKTLGKITTDYSHLSMEFSCRDNIVSWTGEAWIEDISLSAKEMRRLNQLQHRAYFCRFQVVCETPSKQDSQEQELSSGTKELLKAHQSLLKEPSELPQLRIQDHRIHLAEQADPDNVRPYHYPQYQKSEMEILIKQLLNQGFIRPSNSPFSSPIILIKKKDGTWRLCVDYRALNAITIKDRFLIPTIDELLGVL